MDKPRLWTKDFSLITVANMLYTCGFYMLVPIVPLYIAFRGGDNAQVGLVAASLTVAAIATRLFSPVFLRKLNKKLLLRLGLILSVVVIASCALTVTVTGTLLMRMIQGVGYGVVSTICATLAADLLPDERRGEGIGYFGMGTTFMYAFSPSIGLLLTKNYGFGAMFLAAAAGPFLSLVALAFFKPPEEITRKAASDNRQSLLSSFFEPKIAIQCVLLVLYGVCRSTEQNFITLHAEELGVSLTLYFPIQTWVTFAAKYVTGRLYDKKGHLWSVLPGGIAIFGAMITFSLARSLGAMIAGGVLAGIGLGSLLPSMQAWIVSRVGADRRAVASAAYYNYYETGMTVGSIALGALASRIGYALTFRSASAFMAAFLIIYLSHLFYSRRKADSLA